MRQTLRTLERKLVRERAELHARAVMYELLPLWNDAWEQGKCTDYEFEFARRIGACGMHLWTPRVIAYLGQCRSAGSEPDPTRLLQILVP